VPEKPPRPPPGVPTGLDEVERALSALAGRHPDHERARRQTLAAAEKRRVALEVEGAANARRRRRRALALAAYAVALAAAGWVGIGLFTRSRALGAALEEGERPWRALGFEPLATNVVTAEPVLEADLGPTGCYVALATRGAPVKVRVGATSLEGAGTKSWCSCAAGRTSVEAPSLRPPVGLAILRLDAREGGGPLARAWSKLPETDWVDGGRDCADSLLDAWIARGGWPRPSATGGSADGGADDAALARSGFHAICAIEPGRPFGVVETGPEQCAIARAGEDEALSLRMTGGPRPVGRARGALAWCSKSPRTVTVWRDGASRGRVFVAPAARVGGLLGTREVGEIAGLRFDAEALWEGDDDLAWDAGALLRASGLADVVQRELPRQPGDAVGRITALSLSGSSAITLEPAGALVACDPALRSSPGPRRSLCGSAQPVSWWRSSDALAAEAHAPPPVWLSVLEERKEPAAVARIPELVGLARRLLREGFEATLLEGVTELPDGVRIVGRAQEDAVVAVGLAPKAPWVFPYTDSIPWDLGDAPRVVSLQPGDAIKLTASPVPGVPLDKRRTIVFRHSAVQ